MEDKKAELKKVIEKSKKDNDVLKIIDWYLANKKTMGFNNGFDMLKWHASK
jgi:hypothetical protein